MTRQDTQLPKMLRKAICDSISTLFIDVEDNIDVLAEVEKRFNWDELTREPVCD